MSSTLIRIGVTKTITVYGSDVKEGETLLEFDQRNQEAIDSIDWPEVRKVVDTMLPVGFICVTEDNGYAR